jgi:hypothetical protein
MYPVKFLIDYAILTIDVVSTALPADSSDSLVTSSVTDVTTTPDGDTMWRVPDPRPWVGDATYGFRAGKLVLALQAAGEADYGYIECLL